MEWERYKFVGDVTRKHPKLPGHSLDRPGIAQTEEEENPMRLLRPVTGPVTTNMRGVTSLSTRVSGQCHFFGGFGTTRVLVVKKQRHVPSLLYTVRRRNVTPGLSSVTAHLRR